MLRIALLALSLIASILVAMVSSFPLAQVQAQANPLRWAYYVPEDPASLASLRERAGQLDYVGLHWAAMREDATVEIKPNPEASQLVRAIGAKALLSVTAGSVEAAHTYLSSPSLRTAAANNLLQATGAYDGISIDFEGLLPEDRNNLTVFMAELAPKMRSAGKVVTMALSAKSSDTNTGWAGALDYPSLAPHADLFVIMGYGFRTAQSTVPGSVAPRSWVESTIAYAASAIPPQKLLLGVPFYGYDWDLTSGPPARALRYPDAVALATRYGASVQRDPVQGSAYFTYNADGHSHEVWFEDRATIEARLTLVRRYGLAGVAGWRLGHEDPAIWQLFSPPAPTATPGPSPTPTSPPAPPSPPSGTVWYFAEGSTARPFDTWFLLQNPGISPATARLTFMLEAGGTVTHSVLVGPASRVSVFANQLVPSAAFSTRIDSDRPIFVERAMYAGFDGHAVTGIAAPSNLWYLAEGATTSPFHTWILLQNPHPNATMAHLTYLREDGSSSRQEILLTPNSRASIFANQVIPDAAFSTRIESDLPIIAERAMYRFPGNAATGVTAVASPSRSWHFAAGMPAFRSVPVDAWLLLQNPNSVPVTAAVTFYGTDGQTATLERFLLPASRQSLFASQLFSSPSFGIKVEASGEIIAERSVFIGPSAPGGDAQGAYASQGTPQLGTTWVLPEGSTAPPFQERVTVLNPHPAAMDARFEFMLEGGQVLAQVVTIPPLRAFDLEVESVVRSAAASARVTTSLPSVVERTMLWAKDGKTGVHNTAGIRIP